jgi:hypothetical protein
LKSYRRLISAIEFQFRPLWREALRPPADHIVLRLGENQVERRRCFREAERQRFANLGGNARLVGPEAGDPFGGRQRLPNRLRLGIDIETEQHVAHDPFLLVLVATKA